jgi:Bacterial Ig-like domain
MRRITGNKKYVVYGFVIAGLWLSFSRCANIVSPSGGPKDTIPPYLVSADPADSSLHFNANKITLNFSEFVQLASGYNNVLIFAPRQRRQPIINVKLRTITILLKDSLDPNTTYQINFGNTIEDIDEGNPLKNFDYLFSTGKYLDSLQISGNVKYAETGLPDSDVLVMLYKKLSDSVVSKERPLYYTRTNNKGDFLLHNLPSGEFKLFALKEKDGDLEYDEPGQEYIGFISDSMRLDKNVDSLHLYLFKEEVKPDTTRKKTSLPTPPETNHKGEKGKEEPAKKHGLTITTQAANGRQDLIKPLLLQFNYAIKDIDSSKIRLLEDTFNTVVPVHLKLDDTTHTNLQVFYNWKEEMPYHLLLEDGFATDSAGVSSKADTISFRTKSVTEYGSVILQFNNIDTSKHYVVQLVSSNEVIYSAPLKGKLWKVDMFLPGDYAIRLLEDDNQNGKWDTGQYYGVKRQPEIVIAVPQKITVRANWDNKLIISL